MGIRCKFVVSVSVSRAGEARLVGLWAPLRSSKPPSRLLAWAPLSSPTPLSDRNCWGAAAMPSVRHFSRDEVDAAASAVLEDGVAVLDNVRRPSTYPRPHPTV